MAKIPEPDRSRIAETQAGINGILGGMASFVPSLRAAFRYLVGERPETKGQKVACVGFCMGGGPSALLACEEPELAGAASVLRQHSREGEGQPPSAAPSSPSTAARTRA